MCIYIYIRVVHRGRENIFLRILMSYLQCVTLLKTITAVNFLKFFITNSGSSSSKKM